MCILSKVSGRVCGRLRREQKPKGSNKSTDQIAQPSRTNDTPSPPKRRRIEGQARAKGEGADPSVSKQTSGKLKHQTAIDSQQSSRTTAMQTHRPGRDNEPVPSKSGEHRARAINKKPRRDEIIAFRNGEDRHGYDDSRLTGYVRAADYREKLKINTRQSTVCRLPRELIILIMRAAEPEDLFVLRQTARVFMKLFHVCDFSAYQKQTSPIFTFAPAVEFDLDKLSRDEKTAVKGRLRRDLLCKKCVDKDEAAPETRQTAEQLFCVSCASSHSVSCFSKTQLGREEPVCLGWEGKMKLCPHRHVALQEPLPVGSSYPWSHLPCDECPKARNVSRPNLKCCIFETQFTWKVVVVALGAGQIVTKDLVRRELRGLADSCSGFLCPHYSFGDGSLLRPFRWDRCACFREPTARPVRRHCGRHGPRWSSYCCLCESSHVPGNYGTLMVSSSPARHEIDCEKCGSIYTWLIEGSNLVLAGIRMCPSSIMWKVADTRWAARLEPPDGQRYTLGRPDCPGGDLLKAENTIERWIDQLDPETYDAGEAVCETRGCLNARRRLLNG
ncbi:hypothetical protein C8034_v012070 [Colletotrichum sidae]|uniref:F-box domain-containing protein n=1 Tax=Colletotrichum sidae TaxID=1347389 RepID=A0A4R8TJV0_9PEZI|nr:hypothetical protein C8034_v012070 [Colletotrichum sidae]